tara:strand:- start:1105 stop:2613 length:1509 start_codon:yes stop_codon:yes gene_type:complete
MIKIIITSALLLGSTILCSQNNKYLRLYANMGSQLNQSNSAFNTTLNSNYYPFQIGAGSNYKFGQFLIGTEFYNSNGTIKNDVNKIKSQEFTTTLYLGYDLSKSNNFAIEPNIGFSMSNKQSILYDFQNLNSKTYQINQLGISPSLTLTSFNESGVSIGVKIGCNYTLNNHTWNKGIDDSNTNNSMKKITPFIQLNIGGRIKLLKKQDNSTKTIELSKNKRLNKTEKMNTLIDNNGDMLHTTIYPNQEKETIILLHGGPGVPDDLLLVVEKLKDQYQIITFHQRGTKLSPNTSNDYTMKAYLGDIEIIKEHYKLKKFHLWGHSWGGLYAQIYAEKYPDNLLSLFLCSPSSGTNTQWKQTEKEVMHFNKSKCTFGQWSKMGIHSLVGSMGGNRAYQKLFRQVIKNYNKGFTISEENTFKLDNVKAKPVNKTRAEIINYPILKKQETPSYPIAIVYGDKDIYGTSKDFVINRLPSAKVITIKNCGHLPWLHNPKDFDSILKEFY